MPQAIALSPGSLLGQNVITTAATPLMGYINVYNAAAAPLAPALRQAALGTLGTTCLVEKGDTSSNTVTINCYAGETFFDGSTSRVLTGFGAFLVLAIAADGLGIARWKVVGSGTGTVTGPGRFFDGGGARTTNYSTPLTGGAASTSGYGPPTDGGAASTVYGGLLTIDGGTA